MAERSPAIRLSALASTTASAVSGGTFASSSATLRSLSEMNGTPLASCVWRLRDEAVRHVRVVLDAGEERRGQRGDEHRAGERGADRRARAACRCSAARRPRRSARRARPTRSRCRAATPSRRCPSPASSSGQVMISGPAPTSSRASSSDEPANSEMKPSLTTRRGCASGQQLRDADGDQQQRHRQGQQPDAGLDRREAERDRQEQRDDEEQPRLEQNMNRNA